MQARQRRKTPSDPALSPAALFLTYMSEVVVAGSVFIIFLLATWGLHYLGNNLGTTWVRFSWRIFEMSVISFGTLLCVLFFLRTTFGFVEKLKRQLQEPPKQVDDHLSRLHPRDVAAKFGEPLRRQHVGLFTCSVVIIIAILYVGISFAEIARDDCDDASILACEMICETGPDFQKLVDSSDLETILASYAKNMNQKHLTRLLRLFSPYAPEKVFTTTSQTLSNAKGSQEELANAIWRAGEDLMLFRLRTPKLLPREIALHEYRKAPKWLLSSAAVALEESENASKLFNKTPTMGNALHSCECNRRTMLFLFPLRKSYYRPEVASLFTRFRAVVEKCRNRKIEVARLLPDADPRKEFLEKIIAESEQRRLDILDHIKNGNMQEAIERMWDAIEIAYSTRDELLRLCEKIRSAGNYSEEITS